LIVYINMPRTFVWGYTPLRTWHMYVTVPILVVKAYEGNVAYVLG
jgi:hypothetical protein